MKHLITRFVLDQSGATAIEYALIGTLISIGIIAGALALGTQLNIMYTDLSSEVTNAGG